MIRQTFTILERIDTRKEKNIWSDSINTWDDFLAAQKIPGISNPAKVYYDKKIIEAKKHLSEEDSSYFTKVLKHSETWRLYEDFKNQTVFLDIEATSSNGYITIIGLSNGTQSKALIKDQNLDPYVLRKILSKFKLIVTYNGSSYDLPIIKKQFPNALPDVPHIDLKTCCRRIGLSGGLKQIEETLGIKRYNKTVEKIYHGDPYLLWRMYMASADDYYLKLLTEYNEEDTINLKLIADHVIPRLVKNTFPIVISRAV